MKPGPLSKRIIADRIAWIERMLREIRDLPIGDREVFFADSRNIWTAESCLRRALEALFDLGRHILAKGLAEGASEYKEIAVKLTAGGILSGLEGELLGLMAGYRNRLVHYYHEVSPEELYEICGSRLVEVEMLTEAIKKWLIMHPDLLDESL